MIILEGTSYTKRYKCPYCDTRLERNKLIDHINAKHDDMIPKDYTATRVVFNLINKKDHGSCIMCSRETEWNEDKARYERICNRKQCHSDYIKLTDERLKKATGKTKVELLNDSEFQKKMLANRSISGKYKFSDGTVKTYTGTYEKNFLEFMDKYFNVKSEDLDAPGPCVEYKFEGKSHMWITDFYYIPYNLVFDIKDGGDNPNNREMVKYRNKQKAKEKAIADCGKYNYIRLTNNEFDQLIEIMLELKESLIDNPANIKPIIKIHESMDILNEAAISRSELVDKIKKSLEVNGTKAHISKSSYSKFINGTENSLCLGGFGKDNWDNAYQCIQKVVGTQCRVNKDNYFTIFIQVNDKMKESAGTTMGTIVGGAGSPNNTYVINYLKRNTFDENIAICKDKMTDIHIFKKSDEDDKYHLESISFEDFGKIALSTSVYKYTDDCSFDYIVENATTEQDLFILLGNKSISLQHMNLDLEPKFIKVDSIFNDLIDIENTVRNSILEKCNEAIIESESSLPETKYINTLSNIMDNVNLIENPIEDSLYSLMKNIGK